MPVKRTLAKDFVCNHPDCGKAFKRLYDLDRHKRTHGSHEEREFFCGRGDCKFRANQKSGLQSHINNIHYKMRLLCDTPGCLKTFSDPSSLTRHRQKLHRPPNPTGPPTLHSVSSEPPLSVSNYPAQSSSGGGFHPAIDVPPDCWSIDQKNQTEHQAYNANPRAAPASWGYYPDVPVPSGQLLYREEPSIPHPLQSSIVHDGIDVAQTNLDQSCHCLDCNLGGSLTLAPLRGRYQEGMQGQRQSEAPNPFSYPRTGHVPPSDQRWSLTPNDPQMVRSAYLRPNPRMLFDF